MMIHLILLPLSLAEVTEAVFPEVVVVSALLLAVVVNPDILVIFTGEVVSLIDDVGDGSVVSCGFVDIALPSVEITDIVVAFVVCKNVFLVLVVISVVEGSVDDVAMFSVSEVEVDVEGDVDDNSVILEETITVGLVE